MLNNIKTYSSIWLKWYEIIIEIDSNKSIPWIEIIWLPDSSIKESKERIRSTFKSIWVQLPNKKIIINLSPSYIKKNWTKFDLPIAIAILIDILWKNKEINFLDDCLFFWELWLDWSVKKINWLLPCVISWFKDWYKNFFIPYENLNEIKYIEHINIFPIKNFSQIYWLLSENIQIESIKWESFDFSKFNIDENIMWFDSIIWHINCKRALSIAVAWMHNVLMIWPPWSWKSILAKAIPTISPILTYNEILEVSQIYSIWWMLWSNNELIYKRPFRNVHHTASKISIIWWWTNIIPWEISLAHKWVLFFDELPEFPRDVLEVLRQPLENKKVVISRASWNIEYPCDFMFIWAMNPCKCWYYKDSLKECSCTINEIKKYQSKISWPILDRFDIIIDVKRENAENIVNMELSQNIQTNKLKEDVSKAFEIQKKRFKDLKLNFNSQMWINHLDNFKFLWNEEKNFLSLATKKLDLSTRTVVKMIKLSRTIADIQWDEKINNSHIAQALQFRSKNYFIN